jgi:hypothetical protein
MPVKGQVEPNGWRSFHVCGLLKHTFLKFSALLGRDTQLRMGLALRYTFHCFFVQRGMVPCPRYVEVQHPHPPCAIAISYRDLKAETCYAIASA